MFEFSDFPIDYISNRGILIPGYMCLKGWFRILNIGPSVIYQWRHFSKIFIQSFQFTVRRC